MSLIVYLESHLKCAEDISLINNITALVSKV